MKIAQVLNNNVVTVINPAEQEMVVMGRGIGFKKHPGDLVDETKVEKVFKLENREVSQKLMTLLSDIPIEYVDCSDEIIRYAQTILGSKLHDSIYISLTDHIHFAIERYRQGIEIRNAILWEIKKLYRKEYIIGMKALQMIEDKLGVELTEDEGGFIALHFVNSQLNGEMSETISMTNIVKDVLRIVTRHYVFEMDEESLSYFRFLTHLKFFAQRVLHDTVSDSGDNPLHDMVKVQYPNAYACAQKIQSYTSKIHQRTLSKDELLYLTIHIERITKAEHAERSEG
ncbi:PRD domain-containing protein [Paenibacillus sp. PsM32]|uniref:PRD domain-containing protein n=1 Tax=Paenibacillus kyungheensis TaxID=1452732 RepID=A0AAX3M7G6_9BACL|nr:MULTISPECIES: PRD domain-containing protein [Paenibacillus]MDN4619960.1 PRD domain-containing protein [Paenibacillus sp. PsM32]MDQ1233925.1 beta-glucoside operon transcriptional antiterminator [Paenibacillus sp. SORGH_AS_0306]MDR6110970.1 beta-glucoside operon transcriptional antiterminator [Paenibacillus sp. SORGH_AS_0338]WCT57826.1 PRD domain-containing protein [Paenibacillus kyungheensis]WDF49068.1 PRD domain-containing protein [Paenibacillus sp. KACC 21273]